jgi:hypothetical protein
MTEPSLPSERSESPDAPPPVRKRSRRGLVLVLVGVVVVLAGAGTAVAIWQHNKGPGPGTAATAADWQKGGGQAVSLKLYVDADGEMSYPHLGTAIPRRQQCVNLEADVNQAKAYLRIPDEQAQAVWADALTNLASGAQDCIKAIDNNDDALSRQSDNEVFAGMAQLVGLDQRLRQLGGA